MDEHPVAALNFHIISHRSLILEHYRVFYLLYSTFPQIACQPLIPYSMLSERVDCGRG